MVYAALIQPLLLLPCEAQERRSAGAQERRSAGAQERRDAGAQESCCRAQGYERERIREGKKEIG